MEEDLLQMGRQAASRGDWEQAYSFLMDADAERSLHWTDLQLLADVAYVAGHLDVTIETLERAHSQALASDDRVAAAGAATRVAMHLLFDTAMMAPVRGWLKRAEGLLKNHSETKVHAWLAVVWNYERLLSGDFEAARRWARRAIELGEKFDASAAALGRIAEARSLILDGDVSVGLELLEEAAVATVSGELDDLTTGIVYCELVCALQALGQYDLAEEWTQAMERWRHGHPVGSIHGRCRVHRAEILRLRGLNAEAEAEALMACKELRPYLRRELGWPLSELGRIRLRTGDLAGAEQAFLAAHEAGWDPQPGLALLHLARGEVARAVALNREALERPSNIPSKELPPHTELRRAPLLEAEVEISAAARHIDRARWAAGELEKVARDFGSRALEASATAARARVRLMEGDLVRAVSDFDAAIHLWSGVGAPYETALARMGLGEAHSAAGNLSGALLEFQAARTTFERIGAAQHRLLSEKACIKIEQNLPVVAVTPTEQLSTEVTVDDETTDRPPGNAFRKEGEYWSITFDRDTIRLRDARGLRYLARLLAEPGRDFHVLDLVGLERGESGDAGRVREFDLNTSPLSDGGEMLDERAKAAYRRRLGEIDEDLEEAQSMGDAERAAQAAEERDVLVRELARAVGLGGRNRRVGSPSERARVSVTRAIRSVMARLRQQNAGLGLHLDRCIRTGTYCSYLPDPRVEASWEI